jgi:hypothetical protein
MVGSPQIARNDEPEDGEQSTKVESGSQALLERQKAARTFPLPLLPLDSHRMKHVHVWKVDE